MNSLRNHVCRAMSIGAVALLAGCGGSQTPIGLPGTTSQATLAARSSGTSYKVLYSFGPAPDGNAPAASLIDVGGTLYGTTTQGGSNTCRGGYTYPYYFKCGTVFSITTSGTEKVVYSFGPAPDGNTPTASLLDVGGTLYGTTTKGGSYSCGYQSEDYGCGTVFAVTTSGTEDVLYSFGADGGKFGVGPNASLTEVNGALYGTTVGGGTHSCGIYTGNCGTIFSVAPGGGETVLHSFRRGRNSHFPLGSLVDAGGTLYGTTNQGGANNCREASGCGTVFSVTLRGTVKVLHKFGNGTDGQRPTGDLIDVKGTFYGTTSQGGAHGYGTVFSITPAGTEKVLYSFGSGYDGKYPDKDLLEVKGTLYGVTGGGGAHVYCYGNEGCGTVFSITPNGKEKVLHSFGGVSDGISPEEGLIEVHGTLYGTTYGGGASGYGTVFALSP